EEVLSLMYNNYDQYNVLVDYIEKIPIRKPETVIKLFTWVKYFQWLEAKDKILFNMVFQSLLELFSHAARYAPDTPDAPGRYDYDALVGKLVDIPFDANSLYDNLFTFLNTELDIRRNKKELIDFVLEGIENPPVEMDNTDYIFGIKDLYKKNLKEILESQGACPMAVLLEIDDLLNRLITERENLPAVTQITSRLEDLVINRLPYAEISSEAPKSIRERVTAYSKDRLKKDWSRIAAMAIRVADSEELKTTLSNFKKDYLVPQLANHMLTLAYALNAKSPKLRVFLNPNMVRLHNFVEERDQTAWNYCGVPSALDNLSGYYFVGGLSRLNICFAARWQDYLFGRTYVYNSAQLQTLLVNLLEYYPVPRDNDMTAYNALMVDFGLELLNKAGNGANENEQTNSEHQSLREDIISELGAITAGYHYRKAVDYLTGRIKEHDLFFSEIKLLGETFFIKGKYLDHAAYKKLQGIREKLKNRPTLLPEGIYYHTFGNLVPQQFKLFPQEAAIFFDTGWVSGEMIDEFKIKLDWHLYKKKISPMLLGVILQDFLVRTGSKFFSQNHVNDYSSIYFMFKLFNNAHLNGILKKLQQEGYLKLK
ncbi:MAG: hypothetical protein QG657_5905, partial [Acidobacteriota bacterium]|nr:hypothetical protein [Acidobacteriota bacterium]